MIILDHISRLKLDSYDFEKKFGSLSIRFKIFHA